MLQSTARKMEIEKSLVIINPMETVQILDVDAAINQAAMPSLNVVNEQFLVVPTNTPTEATDRTIPLDNLGTGGEWNWMK